MAPVPMLSLFSPSSQERVFHPPDLRRLEEACGRRAAPAVLDLDQWGWAGEASALLNTLPLAHRPEVVALWLETCSPVVPAC